MVAISMAIALATLDTAIANTALPTIAAHLGSANATAIWVVNAYQLAMIAALLPLAALGDILGHRRVYIAGLILFNLASLACGLAWSLPSLVVARVVQGLGAAAIMSVNTALVRFVYPARSLGRGLGLTALVVGLCFTAGPTVTSIILSFATWHWLFLVNLPFGVAAIVLSLRSLPATERAGHGFDGMASLLCAGFFVFLVVGIEGLAHGASLALVLPEWLLAVAFGYALMRRQNGHPAPLLPADLFRRPVFALSVLTAICSFAAQGLAFVALPFLFQTVMGRTAVETGFLITPWPAFVALMAPIAGPLSDRYPAAILCGIGLAILCGGMAGLAMLQEPTTVQIVCWLAVCGLGFGFFQSPNLRALMTSAPAHRSGGASGMVAIARLLGQTIGAALVALCLNLSPQGGSLLALWLGAIFAAFGSLMSFSRLLARSRAT